MALTVLEPTSNGLGSDCFVQVFYEGKLYGLNGSGWSPALLTRQEILRRGHDTMPLRGWLPVMVPGAPAAWKELHRRFGTLPFRDLFEPAISYAAEGFAVMPNLATMLKEGEESFTPYRNDEAFPVFSRHFIQKEELL